MNELDSLIQNQKINNHKFTEIEGISEHDIHQYIIVYILVIIITIITIYYGYDKYKNYIKDKNADSIVEMAPKPKPRTKKCSFSIPNDEII